MDKNKKKQAIEAVKKYRGGFDNATDAQCLVIYNGLDEETKKEYLKKDKK